MVELIAWWAELLANLSNVIDFVYEKRKIVLMLLTLIWRPVWPKKPRPTQPEKSKSRNKRPTNRRR